MLLVVAFRSEEVAEDHLLRRVEPDLHLRLSPFAPDEVRQLVESMAGPLPDDVVAAITRLADGSPFMASAVLRGLVESGAGARSRTAGASTRCTWTTCSRRVARRRFWPDGWKCCPATRCGCCRPARCWARNSSWTWPPS